MKTLILSSFLLFSSLAAMAASVTVVVDGQTYSCNQGGGSSCSCKIDDSNYYHVMLEGIDIASNGFYSSKVDALIGCKRRIPTLELCK